MMSTDLVLTPGRYALVPSTFSPEEDNEYAMDIFSDKDIIWDVEDSDEVPVIYNEARCSLQLFHAARPEPQDALTARGRVLRHRVLAAVLSAAVRHTAHSMRRRHRRHVRSLHRRTPTRTTTTWTWYLRSRRKSTRRTRACVFRRCRKLSGR